MALAAEAYARPADWDNARLVEDPGDSSWCRYPLDELELIELRRCLTANEVRVQQRGHKARIYSFGDRSHTEAARTLLRACYPDLYEERNFEERWYSFLCR